MVKENVLYYCRREITDMINMVTCILKTILIIYAINPALCFERIQQNTGLQKINLNQNGYIQFMAYRIEVPQITQYTFCVWMKSYNLTHIHPLISISPNGREQNLLVYISQYGNYLVAKILNQELLKVSLQIKENKWVNICQSWDSRTGWWQVYMDGKLLEQGISELLRNVLIPKSKDVIVGQDIANVDIGLPGGIHGEIFGLNMVLVSTTSSPDINDYDLQATKKYERVAVPNEEEKIVKYVNELRRQQEIKQVGPRTHNPGYFKNLDEETDYEDIEEIEYEEDIIDEDEVDPDDNTVSNDLNYPSQLLTPPYNAQYSSGTNTHITYDVRVHQPAPGIALYQTPPPFPKYLNDNSKPSFESKYAKENYKGNVKSEKYALDVLNYLKSDKYKKQSEKRKRRPKNNRNVYRRNNYRRYSPYKKGTEIREIFVDPPNDSIGSETDQTYEIHHMIQRRDLERKNINVEIINPETIIAGYKQSGRRNIKNNSGSINEELSNHNENLHKGEEQTRVRHNPKIYSKRRLRVNNDTNEPKATRARNDERIPEEPFEIWYSRLHYTGPQRKIRRAEEELTAPQKSILRRNINTSKTPRPTPRGFSHSDEYRKVQDEIAKPSGLYKSQENDPIIHTMRRDSPEYKRKSTILQLPNVYSEQEKHPINPYVHSEERIEQKKKDNQDINYSDFDIYISKPTINRPQLGKLISSGRKLVEFSFRKCLMEQGSPMAFDQTSLIMWNYTPVTLHGGATIHTANPECGNF